MEQQKEGRRRRRGARVATIVVDVFENGETVPYVQLPPNGPFGPDDTEETKRAVGLAAEALAHWR